MAEAAMSVNGSLVEKSEVTEEIYLKSRVDFKLNAYKTKGSRYRWGYVLMSSTAIVGAATVPVLINLKGVPSIAPTLLSLLVTILVGLEGLLHFREHWRNYDLMKSCLRQERYLFLARAGVYGKPCPGGPLKLFVERVEAEIAKERSETIVMRTSREEDREK